MSGQVDGLKKFVGGRQQTPWRPSDMPVLVVAGAAGGAGTSTVSALLALATAQSGKRTLLIDTDEVVGSLHRILGVEPVGGFSSLRDLSVSVPDMMTTVSDNCVLLAGGQPADSKEGHFDPTTRRMVMRRIAQHYADYDAIVLDAGSRLDGILAAAEAGVRRFLAVTAVSPVAIASAYAIVKTTETRWRGANVDVLFNRQTAEAGRTAYEQIQKATRHFLNRSVGFAGVIPEDAALCAVPGEPVLRYSRATELSMQQLAASLFAETNDTAVV